jgi:2-polyprenyl-6-methoxyphenol hydroxylase-like FAD-dependent oxidoreductase
MATTELAQQQLLIGGGWTAASSGRTYEQVFPYTGEPVGVAAAAGREDARTAVDAAHAAFGAWSHSAPGERRALLSKAADLMMDRQEEIAELLTEETGGVFGWGMFNVQLAAAMMREAAAQAYGLVGELIPSDVPGKLAMGVRAHRIWSELQTRFATDDGWTLHEGPIVEKAITPMRSFVVEPMQYGRLFLTGDAAHIVPPTGAKGLNLAVHDVSVLASALVAWYRDGDRTLLDGYSERCLRRVWRVQQFSNWMTGMLHLSPDGDPFDARMQLAQLEYVCSSEAAARTLAENYVGLERV